jgi:hypothetical protein
MKIAGNKFVQDPVTLDENNKNNVWFFEKEFRQTSVSVRHSLLKLYNKKGF